MYIVAIGWAYVILMVALTASSIGKGLAILVFLGVVPLGLMIYAVGGRKAGRRSMLMPDQVTDQGHTSDSQRN